MRFLASALTATIAAGLISGCSGNPAGPAGGGLPPQTSSQSALAVSRDQNQLSNPLITTASRDLYVADAADDTITVYNPQGTILVCSMSGPSAGINGPDAISFDAADSLYVANRNSSRVTVFRPCNNRPTQTIETGVSNPTAVAVTRTGFVYVANAGSNSVTIYPPGNFTTPMQKLTRNIENPQALAFDSTGVLYVANGATTTHPNGSVAVCTGGPAARTCSKTLVSPITAAINNPRALAIDGSDDVFVANDASNGYVLEYSSFANGNGFVSPVIGQGELNDPNALVFDLSGHLCVSSGGNNEVLCFAGRNVFERLTSRDGIDHPVSLAVDPISGWLKVANDYAKGSVTQYCASCANPSKITNGINGPSSIAIAP